MAEALGREAIGGEAATNLLLDPAYYGREAGTTFIDADAAHRHYVAEGAARGLNPSPFFDTAYYLGQLPPEETCVDPIEHYLKIGWRRHLAPSPFFQPKWYAWQNPDHVRSETPYLHYLRIGRHQGRDPSPMIDMVRYGEVFGGVRPRDDHFEMIISGCRAPSLGVYESWSDLEAIQKRFVDAIGIFAAKTEPLDAPKRNLVLLQCGPQSCHRQWLTGTNRDFDVLVNYYDAEGYDPAIGDYVFFQPGTKFTAVNLLWNRYREILEPYDYVLLLDDDILVSVEKLNHLFEICTREELDLAQMSLSAASQCIWRLFYHRPGQELRHVTGVEIMMPVLSRRAMRVAGEDFGLSVSGFGLDLLLGKKLINQARDNIAVIDAVVADHLKPIDQGGGAYYNYLRSRHINAKAELWRLIEQHDLDMGFFMT